MLKRLSHNSLTLLYSILICAVLVPQAWGWDNESTHQDLSESATNQSVLNYGYLTSNLGVQGGVNSILHWIGGPEGPDMSVLRWIQTGANTEDNLLPPRSLQHFHNPLNNAGLSDLVPFTQESALAWAKDPAAQGGLIYNDDWSWQTTKQHYYTSLTFFFKEGRDAELAQTFYGLGHQIHLLQDMAQPAHVRNDAHFDDYAGMLFDQYTGTRVFEQFETWTKFHQEAKDYIYNTDGLHPPVFPDFSLTSGISLTFDNFWDTDTYNGTSQISRSARNIGLAEYTNSNFFSDDTINTSLLNGFDYSLHNYPFPSKDVSTYSACFETQLVAGNITNAVYYGNKPCDGQGNPTDHFFKGSLLDIGSFQLNIPWYTLDDKVYKDYAKDLLPRAVGYSTSFINYFFRGKLVLEGAGSNGYKIENRSSEALNPSNDVNNPSQLCIYYDQTIFDQSGNPILGGRSVVNINSSGTNCINVSVSIAPGRTSDPFTFTPPTDNYYPNQYWLVYKGTLGGEDNAVIGSFTGSWVEDWNNGITGTHNWWNSQLDPSTMYTVTGGLTTSTTQFVGNPQVSEFKITNFRPAGTLPDGAQYQDLAIGVGADPNIDPYAAQYLDAFPINVTANTALHLKIDEMSTVPSTIPPQYSVCNNPASTLDPGAFQAVSVSFNNGYRFNFTVPGQEVPGYNIYITLGQDFVVYPYTQIFQYNGIPFTEPLQITSIDVYQQLWYICNPTSTDQTQTLRVDFIKVLGQ